MAHYLPRRRQGRCIFQSSGRRSAPALNRRASQQWPSSGRATLSSRRVRPSSPRPSASAPQAPLALASSLALELEPAVFLAYEREAYFAVDGSDLRVTFDESILGRREALSLRRDVWGVPLLRQGETLMEIKCSGGIPVWLAAVLSEQGIFKTSFSKYGSAYQTMIFPNVQGGRMYA